VIQNAFVANYNRLSQQFAFEIRQLLFLNQRQIILKPGVRIRIRVRELIAIVILVEREQYAQDIFVVVVHRSMVVYSVNWYAIPVIKKKKKSSHSDGSSITAITLLLCYLHYKYICKYLLIVFNKFNATFT
jgi:hypothetical protein